MNFEESFNGGPPPAPFLVAILQVIFQTGIIAASLLTLKFVIDTFSDEDFRWSDYIYFIKRSPKKLIVEITDLPLITEDILHQNRRKFIIVALNKIALEKCLSLCIKFKNDNLFFCRIDFLSPATTTERNQDDKISNCDDMLAISPDGVKWSGISLNKKAEYNDVVSDKILNLKQKDHAEIWCLQVLCGKIPWIVTTDKCFPIEF